MNFKAMLAQTINFLHTNGEQSSKNQNFWQCCEIKYFGLKNRYNNDNTMDVTDEDLIAYDIFCAIHEHSQEQFGPIIVQALICHANNCTKEYGENPTDSKISKIKGIIVCI